MDLKNLLNDSQYKAVTTEAPNLRVIAGAGSGKTRVLTYRISYLINHYNVEPWKIVAITFTNKVAAEMKKRVLDMNPGIDKDLHIQTFHSFCARLLREDIGVLGYSRNFTILDDEDQEKIVKQIASDDGRKKNDPIVKQTLKYIASNKCKGNYPEDITISFERFADEKVCLQYFAEYERRLHSMLSLDFDDLLLKTLIILQDYPEIKRKWQSRIDHILIDEFQDTNDIQYKLVRLLKKPTCTLFVVGDPDQTIYTWRGANQKIIIDIEKDFQMETIILAKNYRSTKNILDAANKLISHNKMRVPKDLYTDNEDGTDIKLYNGYRAEDEANWVIGEILKLKNSNPNFSLRDVALLYRSSYLTLPFEKAFMKKQLAYKIYGGLRFFQRMEIKDVLAYFNLIVNKRDDIAFTRIINVPKRGIGDTTIDQIRREAQEHNCSIYEYFENIEPINSEIRLPVIVKVKELIAAFDHVRNRLHDNDETYGGILKDFIIDDIKYYEYLGSLDEETEDRRIDNVNSLFEDIMDFIKKNPESGFEEYLQNVTLLSAQDEIVDGDFVNLMTIHTAKGLEFKYVFVVGLNEGVFPSQRSLEESPVVGLEEERRLCYVAFTRAMEKLYITSNSEYSYTVGASKINSRFIKEAGFISTHQTGFNVTKDEDGFPKASVYKIQPPSKPLPKPLNQSNNIVWAVGDKVLHDAFGNGIVKVVDGNLITVDFETFGLKTLLGSHIKLHKISKDGGFDA